MLHTTIKCLRGQNPFVSNNAMFVGVAGTMSGASVVAIDEQGCYIAHHSSPRGRGLVWNLVERPQRITAMNVLLDDLACRFNPPINKEALCDRLKRIAIGMSGVDWRYPAVFHEVMSHIGVAGRYFLSSIGEVTYCGALMMAPGILIRSGTGSTVYGVNDFGAIHLTNSWDRVVGDQGSGFQISRRLLNIAACQADGRLELQAADEVALELARSQNCRTFTELHNRILDAQEFQGRSEHVRLIADLSRAAFTLASKKNRLALEVLDRCAAELVLGAEAVCRKLGFTGARVVPVVLSGRVLQNELFYRTLVRKKLYELANKAGVSFKIVRGEFGPAVGAALIAVTGNRVPPPAQVVSNLRSTLPSREIAPELYYPLIAELMDDSSNATRS